MKTPRIPSARHLWKAVLSALALFGLGLAFLAYFIAPQQWVASVRVVPGQSLVSAAFFFAAGCLAASQRWRACLAYRVSFSQAFYSLGVANGGNLLIPGRSGEPLRVYALVKRGLPAEFATSGVVQERLADQIGRIAFFALAMVLAPMKSSAHHRMLGILVGTIALFALTGLMIRYRRVLAHYSARTLGRLPLLSPALIERFVRDTLADLASMGSRPGGVQALVWGGLTWGLFTVHTELILAHFFGAASLVMSLVTMAFGTPTAAEKPGYYHFLVVASMMIFSAPKELALRASVVLFFYQGFFYVLWAVIGWYRLRAQGLLAPSGAAERDGQDEAGDEPAPVAPVVDGDQILKFCQNPTDKNEASPESQRSHGLPGDSSPFEIEGNECAVKSE